MCGRLFGAVEELIGQHNVARLVARLQRPNRADTDNPGHSKFFHSPNVCTVIQFARKNPMTTTMPRQEHNLSPGQPASQQCIRRRAKRGFHLDPFLAGKTLNMIKTAAANHTDPMLRHGRSYNEGMKRMPAFSEPRSPN